MTAQKTDDGTNELFWISTRDEQVVCITGIRQVFSLSPPNEFIVKINQHKVGDCRTRRASLGKKRLRGGAAVTSN